MANSSSRMLKLLSLLQTRQYWKGKLLAEKLNVSDRTLRRDIDNLRKLGYRIVATKGPDGGYRLEAGSELPPLLFDDDQAVAIAIALRVAAGSGTADRDVALRALTTVRQLMPSSLRQRVNKIAFTSLPPDVNTEPTLKPTTLVDISAAVKAREILRLDYVPVDRDVDSDPVRKNVEPHNVVFSNGRWYLIAWDLEADEWRVFRIDRITPRIPNGPRFVPRTIPGGDAHTFLAARFKGSNGLDSWPCMGEVILEANARSLTPFIQDGSIEELSPNQSRLIIGSWSWIALAALIARFDAPITHVAPRELGEAFDVLSERFARVSSSSRTQ